MVFHNVPVNSDTTETGEILLESRLGGRIKAKKKKAAALCMAAIPRVKITALFSENNAPTVSTSLESVIQIWLLR